MISKARRALLAMALVACAALAAPPSALAGSDAAFPTGWETWPVVSSGTIPGRDTPIPADAPPIVKETVKVYNWVNDGRGTAYRARVNPAQASVHASRAGDFADGATAVLELVDIKALFVTDHLLGEPQYGVFTFDGKDITGAHPSLDAKACETCHSGYRDACYAGVCSKK